MVRINVVLILALLAVHASFAQLAKVQWVKNICVSDHVNSVQQMQTDRDGNIYTLLSVSQGHVFDLTIGPDSSRYVLIKQDKNGDKVWIRAFSSTSHIADVGSFCIDESNNIVVGGSVSDTFFFDNKVLAVKNDSDKYSAFVLKLNSDGALLWYKIFPSNNKAYVTNIITDKENEVYASVQFVGKVQLGNEKLEGTALSVALVKLNDYGAVLWTKHLHSNGYGTVNMSQHSNKLELYTPQESCSQQILVAVDFDTTLYLGDEKLIDRDDIHYALLEFDIEGHYGRKLDLISTIQSIKAVSRQIYTLGVFWDSIATKNNVLKAAGRNLFIAELGEDLQINNVRIIAKGMVIPTDLRYSNSFGLLAAAVYTDSIIADGINEHIPPGQSNSLIASISSELKVQEMQFVKGGRFFLSALSSVGDNPIGTCLLQDSCFFGNKELYSLYENIFTFQLQPFKKVHWNTPARSSSLSAFAYPLPCTETCIVAFNKPIYGYTFNLYNNLGQICERTYIQVYNKQTIKVNLNHVASGEYYLKLKNCCDEAVVVKVVKQ